MTTSFHSQKEGATQLETFNCCVKFVIEKNIIKLNKFITFPEILINLAILEILLTNEINFIYKKMDNFYLHKTMNSIKIES